MSFIDQLQNFFGVGNNLLQAGESALEGAENSLQNAGQEIGEAFNNCRQQPNQGIFDPGFLKGILDSLRPHHQHHHHRPENHEHHHHHHHHHEGHHEGGRPINWQQPPRFEPLGEGAEQGQQDIEKLERELQKLGQFPFGSING